MYHPVDRAPAPSSTHSDVRPGGMLRARPWLWALAFGLAASQLVLLGVYLTAGLGDEEGWGSALLLSATALCPLVAAAILTRHPGHTVGRLLFAIVVLSTVQQLLAVYADRGLDQPASHVAAWLWDWGFTPGFFTALLVVPQIFPDGHFLPGRGWRLLGWTTVGLIAAVTVAQALSTERIEPYDVERPLAVIPDVTLSAAAVPLLACIGASLASLVVRYRRAPADVRLQIKWFCYPGVVMLALFVVGVLLLPFSDDASSLVLAAGSLVLPFLPVAAGIAILRYRLYDIDLIINRTLVYGVLSALVLGAFGAAVIIAAALTSPAGKAASLVAAGLVAILAVPLRNRLQRVVDRALYGQRDEPYLALAGLSERLGGTLAPDAVLDTIVASVAGALRLPYVAIDLAHGTDFAPEVERGRPRGAVESIELVHASAVVGRLRFSPRTPGEPLPSADRRLLDDLARQAGAAVRGVQLTRELQRSREQLVAAREEERRRLRRDLHDGLGPQLAAVMIGLGAARNLPDVPERLKALHLDLERQIKDAIDDVRRLVYDLRPPQLDEHGLTGAIMLHASALRSGLRITLQAPDDLGALPAAVEIAAYRIATEALTNVIRHAGASHCEVELLLNGALVLEVRDDGTGIAAGASRGVGLQSMVERAEELGGSCVVAPIAPHGTCVRAALPLAAS